MPRRSQAKVTGVWEKIPSSGIWWIRYRENGALLVSIRMAYLAVSRGAQDAQIVTNKAAKLAHELSRDVSHAPANQQASIPHAIEQAVEQRPAREHEISHGFGLGM